MKDWKNLRNHNQEIPHTRTQRNSPWQRGIFKPISRWTLSRWDSTDKIPLEVALVTLEFLFLLILTIPLRMSVLLELTEHCLLFPLLFMALTGDMKINSAYHLPSNFQVPYSSPGLSTVLYSYFLSSVRHCESCVTAGPRSTESWECHQDSPLHPGSHNFNLHQRIADI